MPYISVKYLLSSQIHALLERVLGVKQDVHNDKSVEEHVKQFADVTQRIQLDKILGSGVNPLGQRHYLFSESLAGAMQEVQADKSFGSQARQLEEKEH